MQATHIIEQQGSLLLILGTTMQFGYGPVQTLCTTRHTPPNSEVTPPQGGGGVARGVGGFQSWGRVRSLFVNAIDPH